MKNVENKQLLEIMQKVDKVTKDYHASDNFVGGLFDTLQPSTRVEVWNMATRIDVYIGNITKMYSTALSVAESESTISQLQLKVKKSKNEICIKFSSLESFEIFFKNYYKAEIKEEKKVTKTATKKATATKRTATKKTVKKAN